MMYVIITRRDGHRLECDIRQLGVAGSKRRQMGVVLQVTDQGVLVVGVHVGDDAVFRGSVFILVRHGGGLLMAAFWDSNWRVG